LDDHNAGILFISRLPRYFLFMLILSTKQSFSQWGRSASFEAQGFNSLAPAMPPRRSEALRPVAGVAVPGRLKQVEKIYPESADSRLRGEYNKNAIHLRWLQVRLCGILMDGAEHATTIDHRRTRPPITGGYPMSGVRGNKAGDRTNNSAPSCAACSAPGTSAAAGHGLNS
jgi:hypothetical protein